MVCPWMEHGNLNDYLEKYDLTLRLDERLFLVRPRLLVGRVDLALIFHLLSPTHVGTAL
jgi:hypothetical protein